MTRVYEGIVAHARMIEPRYSFAHRTNFWLVDLDDLPKLPWPLRPFLRFEGKDHFAEGDHSAIRTKLDSWLASRGIDIGNGKVLMLTCGRTLGYVFNPITVYWCYFSNGESACVVAEVHNTYGGRHAYLLHPDAEDTARVTKEFFVSPFHSMDGEYRMHLPQPGPLLALTVIAESGPAREPALVATVRGFRSCEGKEHSQRTVLAKALTSQRVSALIRKHGLALWLRGAQRQRTPNRAGALNG